MKRLANKIKILDLIYKAYQAFPSIYNGFSQLFSLGQWEKWQDRVFPDLYGKKILEIGVGPGRLLIRMAKKGYSVTGIELRSGMAYEARRSVKKAGFDIDILHQSIYDLPFNNAVFDSVVMTFVLAEIRDLDKAIKEITRVLRSGGKVIIIAIGVPKDKNTVAKVLFKLIGLQTTLCITRNNQEYFEKNGYKTTREDFGPFNMIHKIVASKK